ncbi:MAG: peptidase M56, partial [Clostridia bacterium]|nr:peptidase M56 [Clostridia bacterium]
MSGLFITILNMSIAGAVVIAVILIGRLLLKNAPKKWSYLLWIAAAFRLCCPVSIRSAISLFRVFPKAAETAGASETLARLDYIHGAVNTAGPITTAAPV